MPEKLQRSLMGGKVRADGGKRMWRNGREKHRARRQLLVQPNETSFSLPLVGVFSQIMFDSNHLGEPH